MKGNEISPITLTVPNVIKEKAVHFGQI